jgi:repressor LexA
MVRKSAGLTDRHRKILEFLVTFQDENGYPPTIRQIGEQINVNSTSQVTYYLKQLEKWNYIERDEHTSRSIRVLDNVVNQIKKRTGELFTIPVLGRIVASEPIPMPQSDVNYYDEMTSVDVASSLLPNNEGKDLFALEVQGDSMIDAMVNEGDIVILKPTKDANNGDMVAVWLDDANETTLKYFYREPDHIRLQPANPSMAPIRIENTTALRIMGKVVMVVRQYGASLN